jgi:hypothetical protein
MVTIGAGQWRSALSGSRLTSPSGLLDSVERNGAVEGYEFGLLGSLSGRGA